MSAFNFDKWMEKHNIQDAKEILIKHDMITLKNLSMHNRNLRLLVTDPGLCGKIQLIQSVIIAIQTLPHHEEITPLNDTEDKSDEKEEKQNENPFNNRFIALYISSKEDATMQQIQEYVNYMQDLKNDLIESHNKCNISKISNKNAIEKKYKICFKELERIKSEIELEINKLTTKITDQDNSLKSKIEKYQQTVHDEKIKREKERSGINDILNNHSMSINKSIQYYQKHYKKCENIIKNDRRKDENKDDERYASTTNTERERKIVEIGQKEKVHYIASENEIEIYRNQIDEFIQEDLELVLYKTKENINNIDANAPMYSICINNKMYENIANNIGLFMSFNAKTKKRLSRIEMLRQTTKQVTEQKYLFQTRIKKLQEISQKQGGKISSLNKEIERLNCTLQNSNIEDHDHIRPFKLYDSTLWNVSAGGQVMTSMKENSKLSSMVIGYYDSIDGYSSGVHKWSVKRLTGIHAGVRSIGVISPRQNIKDVSLVLPKYVKWNNTGSHFDGQSAHSRWKSEETISVVLNCNEWKVVYYKTTIYRWHEKTEAIKQEYVARNRSYFFALVVDPNIINVYGHKWNTQYRCVETPSACTRF